MQSASDLSSQQLGPSGVRVIVHGAMGRVGARVCRLALKDSNVELVGAIEHDESASIGAPAVAASGRGPIVQKADDIDVLADVLIDFSRADAVSNAIACARRADAALLVGTTGLASATVDALRRESGARAVLLAPNTALGISAVVRIASDAARHLGADFRCSIIEAHHAGKRDSPSGTAIRLSDALSGVGARVDDVHSIRAGDTIGEHTIRFDGPGECIEITHRAVSRDLFALGALHAARWLARRDAGWWTMEDVLGFSTS
jgi:4-hydroxy-tetrahydrodipicolinate reductase